MIQTDEDVLVSTLRAAELLGVSPSTLQSWRFRRRGPEYVQYLEPGETKGAVRYSLRTLLVYKERAQRDPRSLPPHPPATPRHRPRHRRTKAN